MRMFCVGLAMLFTSMAAVAEGFHAGFAQRDVTPQESTPMWGYGLPNRPENMSTGVLDPLYAKALVLDAGGDKLALVGLDLGRGPFEPMMARIRAAIKERAGVGHVFMVGSHTHHGPALEIERSPDRDQDHLQGTFRYYEALEEALIDVVVEAAENARPARLGWNSAETNLNRNRHSDEPPIPRDTELFVMRVDGEDGEPIAIVVNFAAHPTTYPSEENKFSADYPGVMMRAVEEERGAPCIFLQGAAGDMSCNSAFRQGGQRDFMHEIGALLAEEVLALEAEIEPQAPETPSIVGDTLSFDFGMRLDLGNEAVIAPLAAQYGPELTASYREKHADGRMRPEMDTVVVNEALAFVGGPGEFYSALALRLKYSVHTPKTLFLGYSNGHFLYFPTRRAMREGGYGANPAQAWIEEGGPEQMMDAAAASIDALLEGL